MSIEAWRVVLGSASAGRESKGYCADSRDSFKGPGQEN